MRNRTLLSEAEIYLNILSEKREHTPDNTLHDKIFINNFEIPNISISESQNLKKEIKKIDNPIQVIRKYKIKFNFNENNLKMIIGTPISSFQSIKQVMVIVLYSFIVWKIENVDDACPPIVLFSALSFICDPELFGGFEELMFTAISAFHHLYYKTFMEKKGDFGEFLAPLFLMLSQNRNLPKKLL